MISSNQSGAELGTLICRFDKPIEGVASTNEFGLAGEMRHSLEVQAVQRTLVGMDVPRVLEDWRSK